MGGFWGYLGRYLAVLRGVWIVLLVGCLAMGIDPKLGMLMLAEPPAWLVHPATRTAFILAAIAIVLYTSYRWSRIEVVVPEHLKWRRYVTFADAAAGLAKTELGIDRDEILHRLLKAMWLGDFESARGNSRLRLVSADGYRALEGGRPVPLRGRGTTAMGGHVVRNADADPPLREVNRKYLLSTITAEPSVQRVAPMLSNTLANLQRSASPWRGYKYVVPFNALAALKPNEYTADWMADIGGKLAMPQKELMRWLSRLRSGRYHRTLDW